MENQKKITEEEYTIDLAQIAKALWRRIWLIALCGLLGAAIGFSYASFRITPTYSSYIKLYVNNNSLSVGSVSLSYSDLTASKSLVQTYGEILDSRSTLERVIEESGVNYTWQELSSMITYANANNTEIMKVTVTSTDPYEASNIANTIAEVLQERISEIISGASMEVVDSAVPDGHKVAPSITKYTVVGCFLGALVVALILAVIAMLDDTIHNEEYILKTYDFPILGKIPDLSNPGKGSYSYKYQKYQQHGSK